MATAVFIDGGYLSSLLRDYFGKARIDYQKLTHFACNGDSVFRAYYYDCLPYQSAVPTDEERERFSNAQRFTYTLNKLPRFTVRLGKLVFRGYDENGKPIFKQKRVDLLLGIDLASLVNMKSVSGISLIAGDSDLIPAFEHAHGAGFTTTLVHGPAKTYHQDLWDLADERLEIAGEEIQKLAR